MLWPLFGATNQLLAGFALMVTTFYLWRRGKPVFFVAIPMLIMIVMPFWALTWQLGLGNAESGWLFQEDKMLLTIVALTTLALQIWMVIEVGVAWPKAKGVLEPELPPLEESRFAPDGGRSC